MAELIFHGGVLLTQDRKHPTAEALAVSRGKILAVGAAKDILPLAKPGTRHVDLGGRTLIPAFIDAHAHLWKMGHLLTSMVDLRRVDEMAALQESLRQAARTRPPEKWLLGRGYNEAKLAGGVGPTRVELDKAVPDRPVVLTRTCGHVYACNSVALERAGIGRSTQDPPGGVIERGPDGVPTGVLRETAMGLVGARMPSPSRDEYVAMVGAALRHQLSLGITSSNDAGVVPGLLDAYRWMNVEHLLPARVNVMVLRKVDGVGTVMLPEMWVSDHLRIDTVKFLADGGLSGATAALSVDYRHSPTRGVLRFEEADLLELCFGAHQAGWRIATHAIGDVAIDQVIRVYRALGKGPKRHRIEHLGLPTAEHLKTIAKLGVIAVPQTIFVRELGRNFRTLLPDPFHPRTYPVRAMLDAGITVALSSDAPVVEDDSPLAGIQAAVDRRDQDGFAIAPDQAITTAEALFGYTMGGAVAAGDDANRGSLTAGKWADLAVLSDNPLTVETAALATVTVDQTYLAGHLAFER